MGDKLEYRFNYGKTDFSDAKKIATTNFCRGAGI